MVTLLVLGVEHVAIHLVMDTPPAPSTVLPPAGVMLPQLDKPEAARQIDDRPRPTETGGRTYRNTRTITRLFSSTTRTMKAANLQGSRGVQSNGDAPKRVIHQKTAQ